MTGNTPAAASRMHTARPASTSIVRPSARTSVAAPARSRSGNGFPVPNSTTSIVMCPPGTERSPRGPAAPDCGRRRARSSELCKPRDEFSGRSRSESQPTRGAAVAVTFPGETDAYRSARNRLLEREVALRRTMEEVAAERRALPLGGVVPHDYVFEAANPGGTVYDVRLSELFAP